MDCVNVIQDDFWTLELNLNFTPKESIKHPTGTKVVQSSFTNVLVSPHWSPIMTAVVLRHICSHNLLFIQCIRRFRLVVILHVCYMEMFINYIAKPIFIIYA